MSHWREYKNKIIIGLLIGLVLTYLLSEFLTAKQMANLSFFGFFVAMVNMYFLEKRLEKGE